MGWYCYDAKSFNLTACFITMCDTKYYYDYTPQNGGPRTAVYNNVWFKWHFFLAYNISIDWQEEIYICDRTVKMNGQSKMFTCLLALGRIDNPVINTPPKLPVVKEISWYIPGHRFICKIYTGWSKVRNRELYVCVHACVHVCIIYVLQTHVDTHT